MYVWILFGWYISEGHSINMHGSIWYQTLLKNMYLTSATYFMYIGMYILQIISLRHPNGHVVKLYLSITWYLNTCFFNQPHPTPTACIIRNTPKPLFGHRPPPYRHPFMPTHLPCCPLKGDHPLETWRLSFRDKGILSVIRPIVLNLFVPTVGRCGDYRYRNTYPYQIYLWLPRKPKHFPCGSWLSQLHVVWMYLRFSCHTEHSGCKRLSRTGQTFNPFT